jgi:TorA maturation chaperone TorD
MSTTEHSTDSAAVDLAREYLYRLLAAALDDPRAERSALLEDERSRRLAVDAAELIREESRLSAPALGFGELPAEVLDLGGLFADCPRSREELVTEYDRVFGLVPARECPPYETEFLTTAEPFFRAQQLADVAGFYRAFGLEPSREFPEPPDHIAQELEFMAFLLAKKRLAENADQAAVCSDALAAFFRDHLCWWASSFATGLRRKASSGFYADIAQVLAAFLPIEREQYGLGPPRLPLHAALIESAEDQADCAACAS